MVFNKFDSEALGKHRLAQGNIKHFTSRHTRNSIDINGSNETSSMIPRTHQLRASGSQGLNQPFTPQQQIHFGKPMSNILGSQQSND